VLADNETEVEICALADEAKRSFSTTSTLRFTRPRRSLIGVAQLGVGHPLLGNATVRFGSEAAIQPGPPPSISTSTPTTLGTRPASQFFTAPRQKSSIPTSASSGATSCPRNCMT